MFVSNAKLRDHFVDNREGLQQAVSDRELIAVELDQDDGFVARVVLGDLSFKEKAEWIGRGSRRLDLSDKRLVVAGGSSYISEQLDDEFYEIIDVPKGEYFVTVYHHLPFINGLRITRLPEWKGFIPYYRETRSATKRMPDWLAEFADIDGEELSQDEEEYNEDQEMVAFVIQLQPVGPRHRESKLEDEIFLATELRVPRKCPLGIKPVGIKGPEKISGEELAEIEAAERKAHEERFSDESDLAQHFGGLPHAILKQQFDLVEKHFVSSLRDRVAKYATAAFQQAREDAQEGDELPEIPGVNEVWRDGEPAETTLPRWQRSWEDGNNLLDPESVTAESYLGEIRCEFGDPKLYMNGKIDIHMMVDLLITDTPNGPLAAGIAVY